MSESLSNILSEIKYKSLKQFVHSQPSIARDLFSPLIRPVKRDAFAAEYQNITAAKAVHAFLGNTTKTVNPPKRKIKVDEPSTTYFNRYKLQSESIKINPDKRIKNCCISTLGSDVVIKQSENGYNYGNLIRCESVWLCPVCSAHISHGRRIELGEFIERVYQKGHHVSMMTLTVPHTYHDFLSGTLTGISAAFKKFQNRKTWKTYKAEMGITGTVRTLEVTFGKNGWHPHFHVLLISEKQITPLDMFRLLKMWVSAVESSGLPTPNEHGLRLDLCDKSVNNYIQKWGIDYEMCCGNQSKIDDRKGLHPFQILLHASNGSSSAKKIFREYSVNFQGRRQLVYSEGLRKFYSCCEERTDEELLRLEEQKAHDIAVVSFEGWKQICKLGLRGDLLDSIAFFDGNVRKAAYFYSLQKYFTFLDNPH